MLGPRSRLMRCVWISVWYVVTPCFTMVIFVSMILDYKPPVFSNGEDFPGWTIIFGWCLACFSLIPIPVIAAVEVYRNRDDLKAVSSTKPV